MSGQTVPAISFVGADVLIRELGGDLTAIARAAHFPTEAFDSPDLPVAIAAGSDFLEFAALACQRSDFGLLLARRQELTFLGPIYAIMTSCETIGDAVSVLVQQLRLHSNALNISSSRIPDGLRIDYSIHALDVVRDRQAIELGLALLANFIRLKSRQDWKPVLVQFRHSKPAAMAEHRKIFGENVLFDQDRNAISIDSRILGIRINPANPEARKVMVKVMRQRTALAPDGLPQRVEAAVHALLPFGANCSIASIAAYLGMSVRTLQRRLESADINFMNLRDQVRADLARKYLLQSGMSLSEISVVLGFSDPSAFARSFRRWNQMSPQRFRRQDATKITGFQTPIKRSA